MQLLLYYLYFPRLENLHAMCFHRRFVYTCGHDGWGAEIAACDLQRSFDEGTWLIACPNMFSHPFHCLKLQTRCQKCHRKAAKATQTAETLARLKLAMVSLKETVRKLETHGEHQRKDVRVAHRDCPSL
jgi:hypothetical protein